MKHILTLALALAAFTVLGAQSPATLSNDEVESIAIDAFIYGYPIVTMDLTREFLTNTATPENFKAPMGQFFNARSYPDPEFHAVTTPNADTLYSSAWIDLTNEPYILHVPDMKDRYYMMPMMSMWTDVFASPGTRTTGDEEQDFVITGPNWTGKVPEGLIEYKSPTNIVWIIGRTYSTGTTEDYRAVHAVQNEYMLKPLSYYGKPYTPPNGIVDHQIDEKLPVRTKLKEMKGTDFFNRLMSLLQANPPTTADKEIAEKMAKIGIVPVGHFEADKLDPQVVTALNRAPKIALEKIAAQEATSMKERNGWGYALDLGTYGTDYLRRALVAMVGLGSNLPQDAVYMYARKGTDGKPFDGTNNYVIHFPKGQTPPVKGFWSLTMYNTSLFFVENVLERYTLSPRNALQYNPDGSLDLYIQNKSPGKEKESNWLPAPPDGFVLVLRSYWPEQSLLTGAWTPPPVTVNP